MEILAHGNFIKVDADCVADILDLWDNKTNRPCSRIPSYCDFDITVLNLCLAGF